MHVRYGPFQMVERKLYTNDTTELCLSQTSPADDLKSFREGIGIDSSASFWF